MPLTGPDDWRIVNEAKSLFVENDMPARRKVLVERIYRDFDAGKITEWAHVHNYQQEHSDKVLKIHL